MNLNSRLWVINGPRVASELGPLIPRQRTCGDYFSMSVSCHNRTRVPQQLTAPP